MSSKTNESKLVINDLKQKTNNAMTDYFDSVVSKRTETQLLKIFDKMKWVLIETTSGKTRKIQQYGFYY
jgi:hypothetical protein